MKPPTRTIWVVRHGERVDNIDKSWKETAVRWDDPPLSTRGHKQADEVGVRLANEQIDHVFTSPFTRCIQTLHGVLSRQSKPPQICVEPGLSESLNVCNNPPGRPSMDEIKKLTTLSIKESYAPVYVSLPPEYGGDGGCITRVADTVQELVKRHPTGNVLIVSHGSPIAAVHLALINTWNYVGQCTLGKIVDTGDGRFTCEFYGSAEHLSDKTNLRGVQTPDKRDKIPLQLQQQQETKTATAITVEKAKA